MMNELQAATFNNGLTFHHFGINYLKMFTRVGEGSLRKGLANLCEYFLNLLDSEDKIVPILHQTMKALRK